MSFTRFFPVWLLLLTPSGAYASDLSPGGDTAPTAEAAPEPSGRLADLLAQVEKVDVTPAEPFLWLVTSDKKNARGVVWITGSLHLGRPEMYPLDPAIEGAFKQSQKLAVEMDVSAPSVEQEMARRLLAGGMLPEGQSLKALLPGRYEELKAALSSFGIPIASIDGTTPFLIGTVLSVNEMVRAGWDPNLGIDRYFLTAARAQGKEIVELEGLERQLRVFREMPLSTQLVSLRSTLDHLGALDAWASKVWEALRAGDTDALLRLQEIEASEDEEEFHRVMLLERNAEMAAKLALHARKGRDAMFVVVGALHVPGEQGLIDLLTRDKRLKVTRFTRE